MTDRAQDRGLIRRMCEAMRHRGPDDYGEWSGDGVALGMRRLAIIDVESGRQPVWNEDRSVAVVFNGEIYNFPHLRRELQSKGHQFSTQSDTECLVHLYEEKGERLVEDLRGMFVFAIWDARHRRLLLGRDRVGKKPLFYRLTAEGIWFGSELKALLQDQSFSRSVDPVALHHYLTYQYVPTPWSIYEGVRKLPPAHTLSLHDGHAVLKRYWRLDYLPKLAITDEEATGTLKDLILEATRIRLVSERPVGAFLSGGVDSSIVVAAMAEQMTQPVKTFTIGFEESRFDERRYARLTAERFGTDHHEYVVRPSALEVLETLVWHYDEPYADSSAIPSYYLSKLTAESVTVALNGDGGDESFGGYSRYIAHLAAGKLPLPVTMRLCLYHLARAMPYGRDIRSPVRRAKRALDILSTDPRVRYAHMIAYFNNDEKRTVYTKEMQALTASIDSYALLDSYFAQDSGDGQLDQMLRADVENYLPGDLLTKMDIATMANSLEARSPLLDHHIMEFAARLPATTKVRGTTSKYLLKNVARGWIPAEIIDRPKRGFSVPLAAWLRGELRHVVRDALCDRTAAQRGYFDPRAVNDMLVEHDNGADHSVRIWALLQFELWHRMFIDENATAAPVMACGGGLSR